MRIEGSEVITLIIGVVVLFFALAASSNNQINVENKHLTEFFKCYFWLKLVGKSSLSFTSLFPVILALCAFTHLLQHAAYFGFENNFFVLRNPYPAHFFLAKSRPPIADGYLFFLASECHSYHPTCHLSSSSCQT